MMESVTLDIWASVTVAPPSKEGVVDVNNPAISTEILAAGDALVVLGTTAELAGLEKLASQLLQK